jgi:acetolactate synthase-1/2/3 large subunit
MTTCGEFLVKQLEAWGVDTVFGIPGVHTVELYRGLPHSKIRHITPRHEQGAGFMADGYARVSGKPGLSFIITGPGITNNLTAMAQAYADSIPMLVISSVNQRDRLGLGKGYLHELPNQRTLTAGVTAFSHTLMCVRVRTGDEYGRGDACDAQIDLAERVDLERGARRPGCRSRLVRRGRP